jgi:hypothetical protein
MDLRPLAHGSQLSLHRLLTWRQCRSVIRAGSTPANVRIFTLPHNSGIRIEAVRRVRRSVSGGNCTTFTFDPDENSAAVYRDVGLNYYAWHVASSDNDLGRQYSLPTIMRKLGMVRCWEHNFCGNRRVNHSAQGTIELLY